MADVTGAIHHEFGGKTYELRLTMRVIAALQDLHGNDLGGWLSADEQGAKPFRVMLDGIQMVLDRGGYDGGTDLADEMLTASPDLFARLLAGAFPVASGAQQGNGQPAARKRG